MESSNIISDNQAFLKAAVQCKNIHRFRLALLLNGVSPEAIDEETHLSLFEQCCRTPGYHDFIKECIRWGCDVNRTNPYFEKRPINFAAESNDLENIKTILEDPTRQHIKDPENDKLSPIYQLASNLNTDNFESIFQCLKELIDRHVNVNTADANSTTPLMIIAQNDLPMAQKECVIRYFLENSTVDIDSYGNGETRLLLNRMFPHLSLPEKNTEKRNWDFIRLITALRDCEENEFLSGLDIFIGHVGATDEKLIELFRERFFSETLLMVAAKNGLPRAAEKLLRYGADPNNYGPKLSMSSKKPRSDLDESSKTKSPVELACIYGNWEVLDLLLKCSNICIGTTPLLVNMVRNIGEVGHTRSCDYRKCFYLLLNFQQIDVNQMDAYGCTALHIAVKYNNQMEVLALLSKGACIGAQNKLSELPIIDINPKLLELHFNSCITTNGLRSGDDNYEIRFNYANLVPLKVRKPSTKVVTKNSNNFQCTDEMAPIEYIARTPELKNLVKHPLIASFLFLKWHQLALVFYANFVCYTIYCLAIILYLLFCFGQDSSRGIAAILYLISSLGALYVVVREIAQLVMSPSVYIKNKENYLEIALIIATILVLCNFEYEENTRRTISAITILLAVTEFFLLTGSLPFLSFSTHLVMLKTVSKSFVKGLLLYSIILIAFALCFYMLLGQDDATSNGNPANNAGTDNDNNGDNKDIEEFNNFVYPGIAMIKSVVMLTGEFDASNIHFKRNGVSYLVFVIFVFLISTVLSNLLNGLAISDTAAIKSEAELLNFIYRAKLMARYEKILLGKGDNVCCNFLLRKWSSTLMNIFPDFLPLNILAVLPNSNNQVVIPISPTTAQTNAKLESIEDGNTNFRNLEFSVRALNCCFGIKCSRMEVKIVKYAKYVLDTKGRDYEKEKGKQTMQQRIIRIEDRVDDMVTKVEQVFEILIKN